MYIRANYNYCRNVRRHIIKITLIRHGKTESNIHKKYIGLTDEPLCSTGIDELNYLISKNIYPKTKLIYSSPLARCLQTSNIIYKNIKPIIVNDFKECNFGDFEGKNHEMLKSNDYYKLWLESGGQINFPNGEHPNLFRQRCEHAFLDLITNVASDFTVVCHGGTIMSILAKYTNTDFYNWHVHNGNGFSFDFDLYTKKVTKIKLLWVDDK